MARKRMIDPAFFLDEEVSSLSPHARILYIGTWTLADDVHFTLPKKPDWIKAQIFPYEMKLDVAKLIDEIVGIGKYVPFTNGDGKEYLFIPTMAKHQTINRPSKPKYPPHPEEAKYMSAQGVVNDGSLRAHPEYKLIEVKLIEVIGVWNECMPWKVQAINDDRIRHFKDRMKEEMFMTRFKDVLNKIKASDFLSGRKPTEKFPNFKADFDWVIANDSNYVKVLEGKYDGAGAKRRSDGG